MRKVEMRPLPKDEFDQWRVESKAGYAAEKVAAGNWPAEEADTRAEKSFVDLLPEGQRTKDHYFYSLWSSEHQASIGVFWFHLIQDSRKVAFIYDFVIYPEYRGKGLGRASLLAAEVEMKRQGAKSSGLHVFAHNTTARRLYETCGYEVTNLNMSKSL